MSTDTLLKSLNKAQCRAVTSQASTLAILAGPGSGKTHTLTSRVVWLIDHVGYQPCDIIVATFTVKASREMKERIGRALGGGRENKIVLGTFHSIARRYLAAYGQRIGLDPKFGIADSSDTDGIIRRICKRLDVKIDPPTAKAWISKKKAKGSEGTLPSDKPGQSVESRNFEICYEEYQNQLKKSNLLDYDDLLILCVELLRKHPSVVRNVQAVLIDEYQDTNGVQYELMRLFAQERRRVTVVGDPDQSIYGWRSAEIKNLHRFLREFKNTEEISLEENYRSSSSILDVSLKVIQQDDERYQKVLVPVHSKGTRPVLRKLKNPLDEAEWIISEIKRIALMTGSMITNDDVAILLRSASLSGRIESALGKAGLAYKMVGGFKFYDRVEVKIVLDYLRVIHQPDNNDAVQRIINVPRRGIGDDTVKSLLEEAEKSSLSLWKLLDKHCRGDRAAKTKIPKQTEQNISGKFMKLIKGLQSRARDADADKSLDLVELIEKLLVDLQLEQWLEEKYKEESETRWENVRELVGLANAFTNEQSNVGELLPEIEGMPQAQEDDILARFLATISLAADKQTADKGAERKPQITVSTIHAAKGLEWPVVFIPAVYKGSIPHMRSDDDAEERRLLYVAMTRAQALLYLSTPQNSFHGNGEGLQLSPFIESLSQTCFLSKGPSFQRQNLEELAIIVRRRVPSEKDIYDKLPMRTQVEDNLFPVDPNETKPRRYAPVPDNHSFKRQKTNDVGLASMLDVEQIEGWNIAYKTTMEKADLFTVPGFTTAAAQHAIAKAEHASNPSTGGGKHPPARGRQAGQRSLKTWVLADHDQSQAPSDDLPSYPRDSAKMAALRRQSGVKQKFISHAPTSFRRSLTDSELPRPSNTTIDPALGQHRLGGLQKSGKPQPQAAPEANQQQQPPKRSYSHFSSSPTKAPSDDGHGDDSEDKENDSTGAVPDRPAACFHATTMSRPIGSFQSLRKPAGLTREGIAPVDRLKKPPIRIVSGPITEQQQQLRKPFRPLSIKGRR